MIKNKIQKKTEILNKLLPNKKGILLDYVHFSEEQNISIEALKKYWEEKIEWGDKDQISFYIHLPFCATICKYCMYNTIQFSDFHKVEAYIDAMISFLEDLKDTFQDTVFAWIYVWWGTPSLLQPQQLKRLFTYVFSNFRFDNNFFKEIELNPSSTNFEKLDVLSDLGFDRISLGVQSFNKETLKIENRTYVPEEKIRELVSYAKSKNFRDINLDIIAGLNKESEEEIYLNLEKTLSIEPYSITIYTILKDMERSVIFQNNPESFYKDIELLYKRVLDTSSFQENYSKEEWSNVLGFTLHHKDSPKKKYMYDAHKEDPGSIFSAWFKSFWKIFGKGTYETKIFWEDFLFWFREHSYLQEFYSSFLQSFQFEVDYSFFQQHFGLDFSKKYADEIHFLSQKGVIELTSRGFRYIWDKNMIGYYGLLFLDIKNMIACIKERFYEKK